MENYFALSDFFLTVFGQNSVKMEFKSGQSDLFENGKLFGLNLIKIG